MAQQSHKKQVWQAVGGFAVGILNGFLGAGGGMLAVPLLKKQGLAQKQAHASAIAVIFPLSCISASLYLVTGHVNFMQAAPFLPAGIVGALFGIWLMPRLPDKILRKVFAVFILWAGVRMIFRK